MEESPISSIYNILERVSDGFVALDKNWHYVYVNKRAGEMFGRKPEELIGKHIWTEFPEGIDQPFYKAYYRAMEEQVTIHIEEYYPSWDRWFENCIYPSSDGLTIFFKEITERKKIEATLLAKEHLLSESQRIAHVGNWFYDMTGHITWSDEMYHIYVVSSDTFTPNPESFLNLIHPDDRPAMQAWIKACLAEEKPGELEFRSNMPDGTVRFISGRGELMYDAEKRPTHLSGTAQDITDRKRAEEALRESEEKFSLAFHSSPAMFGLATIDGKYVDVNKAYADFLGYSREEIIGKTLVELQILTGEEREKVLDLARKGGGSVYNAETKVQHRDGSLRYILFSLNTISIGGVPHRLLTLLDITGRKQAEEEIRAANEKIAQHAVKLEEKVGERTAELEQANIKLKELDRLKSMFIASMSHELRTPLNSIIGFTGIILQGMSGDITEEQRKQLSIVQMSAKHLLALISDVIDVSKIEADKVELYIDEFDLSVLMREVIESFSNAADVKMLKMSLDAPAELMVKSDERRIKQVLNNLLSNAVKFTEKGSIDTRVIEDNKKIIITVRDTGIGIKEDDQKNLFKAFSKFTHDSSSKPEGTGLGLYLSQKIAGLLGGELRAESEFGKGSLFTFVFPRRV